LLMFNFPAVPTYLRLCDALHWRHGFHNMIVTDVEANIEIPVLENNDPDLSIVQKLWWTGINLINAEKQQGRYPVRVLQEMRVMAGSDTILAAQHGNKYTCSIEVLSLPDNNDEFLAFAETVVASWKAIADEYDLNFKLHWGKQWTKVDGMEYTDYLKQNYCEDLLSFKQEVSDNAWQRFSTPTFNSLFGDITTSIIIVVILLRWEFSYAFGTFLVITFTCWR